MVMASGPFFSIRLQSLQTGMLLHSRESENDFSERERTEMLVPTLMSGMPPLLRTEECLWPRQVSVLHTDLQKEERNIMVLESRRSSSSSSGGGSGSGGGRGSKRSKASFSGSLLLPVVGAYINDQPPFHSLR